MNNLVSATIALFDITIVRCFKRVYKEALDLRVKRFMMKRFKSCLN